MSQPFASRGLAWFQTLAGSLAPHPGDPASLRVADIELDGYPVRFLAVVSDPDSPFPRARQSEGELLKGWGLAVAVDEALEADRETPHKRALLVTVDVPSRAYSHCERTLGTHQALAGAVDAYARARLAGHPLIGPLVGKAMSSAFPTHGYQANRLITLHDPGIMIHAMGKAAAARITLRSVRGLEALAAKVPPMAYDIGSYASFDLLWRTLPVETVEVLSTADLVWVHTCLGEALADIFGSPRGLGDRLGAASHEASAWVHRLLHEQQ